MEKQSYQARGRGKLSSNLLEGRDWEKVCQAQQNSLQDNGQVSLSLHKQQREFQSAEAEVWKVCLKRVEGNAHAMMLGYVSIFCYSRFPLVKW